MNAKRRITPKNSKGYCSIVFLPKNNSTVSKQAQNFSKPWENDSTAQSNEESTEIAEFYLENKKKSKKKPMLKL